MKQFENKEQLNKAFEEMERTYLGMSEKQYDKRDIMTRCYSPVPDDYFINKLINDGYDLDNLTADGHLYNFFGHSNNGWLYEDEADIDYIQSAGLNVELRKR